MSSTRAQAITIITVITVWAGCQKDANVTQWTGEGDGRSWSDADNWKPSEVPRDAEAIRIDRAVVTVTGEVSIAAGQTLTLTDATVRIADGATLSNRGTVVLDNGAIAEAATGALVNAGSIGGQGAVSFACGGGAAPDTGDIDAAIGVVICAAPCDPADSCCTGGPTGCTHPPEYWKHQATWPIAKTETLCGRRFDAILRADDLGDLESDSGSDSDPCSESSESDSSSSESASANESGPDSGSISSDSDSYSDEDGEEAWFVLAHSYIAAVLNQADGASSTPRVDLALAEARDLLTSNCDGLPASALATIRELDLVLSDYNLGLTGPGPCPDEPIDCPSERDVSDVVAEPLERQACFDTGFGMKCLTVNGELAR